MIAASTRFFARAISCRATMIGTLLLATVASARAELTYNTDQTADGTSLVVVAGEFEATDDLARFRDTVRSHHVRHGWLQLARRQHRQGPRVRQAHPSIRPRHGPDEADQCASACALAFMGGVRRIAEAGAIGVHKSSFADPEQIGSGDAVAAVQDITAEMIDYMIEMGVDPALLRLSLRYGSDDMRYLAQSEMALYRVVTADTVASAPRSDTTVVPVTTVDARFQIPEAVSGRIRSSQKAASLTQRPNTDAKQVGKLANGMAVQIIGSIDRWYRVRAGDLSGFLPQGVVAVDQYESGPFDERYIQVKSLSDFADRRSLRSLLATIACRPSLEQWHVRDCPCRDLLAKSCCQQARRTENCRLDTRRRDRRVWQYLRPHALLSLTQSSRRSGRYGRGRAEIGVGFGVGPAGVEFPNFRKHFSCS